MLLIYCDVRIDPKGILPIRERFADLKLRAPFVGIDDIAKFTPKLENAIQTLTLIKLNSDHQQSDQLSNSCYH